MIQIQFKTTKKKIIEKLKRKTAKNLQCSLLDCEKALNASHLVQQNIFLHFAEILE